MRVCRPERRARGRLWRRGCQPTSASGCVAALPPSCLQAAGWLNCAGPHKEAGISQRCTRGEARRQEMPGAPRRSGISAGWRRGRPPAAATPPFHAFLCSASTAACLQLRLPPWLARAALMQRSGTESARVLHAWRVAGGARVGGPGSINGPPRRNPAPLSPFNCPSSPQRRSKEGPGRPGQPTPTCPNTPEAHITGAGALLGA